mmetsp:Transcript_60754/g.131746  ORF Transcript_60754/g.131746 Transcript_60754/m.131746 type:complete len:178 (+) Transcript_60754:77-610(+)
MGERRFRVLLIMLLSALRAAAGTTLRSVSVGEVAGLSSFGSQVAADTPDRPAPQDSRPPAHVEAVPYNAMSLAAVNAVQNRVEEPVSRPKGWDQCLIFARFVKTQKVTGVEFVRVWKATCEPAVRSGRATSRYRLMCDSLGGAVEPYAGMVDYSVEQLCDSVLAVFHDVTAADRISH